LYSKIFYNCIYKDIYGENRKENKKMDLVLHIIRLQLRICKSIVNKSTFKYLKHDVNVIINLNTLMRTYCGLLNKQKGKWIIASQKS